MVFTLRIPDESLSLPPPNLVNWGTMTFAMQGWLAALLDNAIKRKPILGAGVHRQILYASIGFGVGYYLARRTSWRYAHKERELVAYQTQHPEDFKPPERKIMSEVLDKWHPVR